MLSKYRHDRTVVNESAVMRALKNVIVILEFTTRWAERTGNRIASVKNFPNWKYLVNPFDIEPETVSVPGT